MATELFQDILGNAQRLTTKFGNRDRFPQGAFEQWADGVPRSPDRLLALDHLESIIDSDPHVERVERQSLLSKQPLEQRIRGLR